MRRRASRRATGIRGLITAWWWRLVRIVWLGTAALWRRLMWRVTVIAVTGSVGKTSAKDLIAAVLAPHFSTVKSVGTRNHYRGLGLTMMSIRPWHRYAVVEVGLDRPGQMKWFARVVRPHVVVWVNVARTHTDTFESLEQTAREKARLVDALRPGGVAILNSANEYIARYTPPAGVRTLRYGAAGADYEACDVNSAWPCRLSFRLRTATEQIPVPTRFLGTHWVSSVLPAFAVASLCGVDLHTAARAVASVEPYTARLSPAALPNGAIVIRDEFNGSADTLKPALEVLRHASAERKFLVMSDVSDSRDKPRRRIAKIARAAAEFCDGAVFIGGFATHGERAAIAAGMSPERVRSFIALQDAVEFLRAELRAGDLVLLRGRNTDHLSRVYLALLMTVNCWRDWCPVRGLCDGCGHLTQLGAAARDRALSVHS